MSRNAFLNPTTQVLKAHGFVESNAPGDVKLAVSDDFALEPGKWLWDGAKFVSFVPPIPLPSALAQVLDTITTSTGVPTLLQVKAVFAEWRKLVT